MRAEGLTEPYIERYGKLGGDGRVRTPEPFLGCRQRRGTMVPASRENALVASLTICYADDTPLSVAHGAGRVRPSARTGTRRAGDRPLVGTSALHDLTRAAPQCGYAQRWLGVSGDDGPVARRSIRSASEAGQAGDPRGLAGLRAGVARGMIRPYMALNQLKLSANTLLLKNDEECCLLTLTN